MCTLILFRNVFAFSPLFAAANRDERYDRPSEPLALELIEPDLPIWAPKDLEAGGTWIGVSRHGVFAAVLNRHDVAPRGGCVSRGTLPLYALRHRTAREAAKNLSRLDGRAYDGFSLVVADADEAFLVRGDGMGVRVDPLLGRLHVLTDRGIDDNHCPRTRRIRELYMAYDRRRLPAPETLGSMLSFHDGERGRDGACVHSPDGTYGTRSSTFVRLDDRKRQFELWHREGPACDGEMVIDRVRAPIID